MWQFENSVTSRKHCFFCAENDVNMYVGGGEGATENQREWDGTQPWNRGNPACMQRSEHRKELVDCGEVWEQPWGWFCQGVVSHDLALLSHLGHRALQKPYRKGYPHIRWMIPKELYVKAHELMVRIVEQVKWAQWQHSHSQRKLENHCQRGNSKKILHHPSILIYVEKDN